MLKKHMNILRKTAIDFEYMKNNYRIKRKEITGKIFRSETKSIVLDGHRIFSTKENVDINGCISVEDQCMIDLCKRYIKDVENCTFPVIIDKQILTAFCKEHRYNTPYVIDLGFCYLGINPLFLRDQLDFIGTDTVFINPEKLSGRFCYIGLIYAGNEDRESIVLPINLSYGAFVYGIQQDAAGKAARKGY